MKQCIALMTWLALVWFFFVSLKSAKVFLTEQCIRTPVKWTRSGRLLTPFIIVVKCGSPYAKGSAPRTIFEQFNFCEVLKATSYRVWYVRCSFLTMMLCSCRRRKTCEVFFFSRAYCARIPHIWLHSLKKCFSRRTWFPYVLVFQLSKRKIDLMRLPWILAFCEGLWEKDHKGLILKKNEDVAHSHWNVFPLPCFQDTVDSFR